MDEQDVTPTKTQKKSKRSPSSESTGERLMTGAAELFRKKGYAATSTRELSALLGLEKASLYHHMDGKEDLLYRLCIGTLEDVAKILLVAKQIDDNPLATLERMARKYVALSLNDRDRHATMLAEIRALSDDRRERVIALRDENVRMVREVIIHAQQAKQIRDDIAPKYLTLSLFNLLNWSIFWYSPDDELSPGELGDILWSIFSNGVTVNRPNV
jgi:TetR/AcrR family transcriptional regulator, cholesterol catabolism regulator